MTKNAAFTGPRLLVANPTIWITYSKKWLLYWGTEIPLNGYVHYIALFEKANMEYTEFYYS